MRAPPGTPRRAATPRNTSAASLNRAARIQNNRGQVQIDLSEHVGQRADRDLAVAEPQPQRADSPFEVLHDVLPATAGSGSACRCRTSHPVRWPAAVRPRTNGACPG